MSEYASSDAGAKAGSVPERAFRPFQILIRLQYLRSQIRDWVRGPGYDLTGKDIEEILLTLRGLAATARTTGAVGIAKPCLPSAAAGIVRDLVRRFFL